MNRPLFKVDENVWLASKNFPQDNGQTVVHAVLFTDSNCNNCNSNCHSYHLSIPDDGLGWCECALRKRPDPGSSFESIMDELKDKVPA